MDEKSFHSADLPEKVNLNNCQDEVSASNKSQSQGFILPWPPYYASSAPPPPLPPFNFHGFNSSSMSATTFQRIDEEPAVSGSSKSHSQAEKRRRERINSHLATLRRLIPRADKMDKAALLGCVVDQVKELKRKVIEIGQVLTIPSEFDEVIVADCDESVDPNTTTTTNNNNNKGNNSIFLRASVCCEDRPDLYMDLIEALNGLKLRTVRADMVSMGGRIINVLILCSTSSGSSGRICLRNLKQSLRAVLGRVITSSSSMIGFSSKRQRLLFPSQYAPSFLSN